MLVPLGRRLAAVIETGDHPATALPILTNETCGTCTHRAAKTRLDGRTKCELAGGRGGPNLPAHTPGCTAHARAGAAA